MVGHKQGYFGNFQTSSSQQYWQTNRRYHNLIRVSLVRDEYVIKRNGHDKWNNIQWAIIMISGLAQL